MASGCVVCACDTSAGRAAAPQIRATRQAFITAPRGIGELVLPGQAPQFIAGAMASPSTMPLGRRLERRCRQASRSAPTPDSRQRSSPSRGGSRSSNCVCLPGLGGRTL
jgi:hypothetical protein